MMFEYSKEKPARFESIFSFKNECVFIYQNILEKDMNYVKNPTEKKWNKNLLERERDGDLQTIFFTLEWILKYFFNS